MESGREGPMSPFSSRAAGRFEAPLRSRSHSMGVPPAVLSLRDPRTVPVFAASATLVCFVKGESNKMTANRDEAADGFSNNWKKSKGIVKTWAFLV